MTLADDRRRLAEQANRCREAEAELEAATPQQRPEAEARLLDAMRDRWHAEDAITRLPEALPADEVWEAGVREERDRLEHERRTLWP